MRDLLRGGESLLMVVVMMVVGSLGLWVGVPVAWLWIGSQVQAETGSIGAALATMFVGSVVSILLLAGGLAWLNAKHQELREARGLEHMGSTTLELVLVVSAALALIGFTFWFFVIAGPGPSLAPSE